MEKRVLHHGSGMLGDGTDGTFSDTILVMGADARKVESLVHGVDVGSEFGSFEYAIVAMVLFDLDSILFCHSLELSLGYNGVKGAQ